MFGRRSVRGGNSEACGTGATVRQDSDALQLKLSAKSIERTSLCLTNAVQQEADLPSLWQLTQKNAPKACAITVRGIHTRDEVSRQLVDMEVLRTAHIGKIWQRETVRNEEQVGGCVCAYVCVCMCVKVWLRFLEG